MHATIQHYILIFIISLIASLILIIAYEFIDRGSLVLPLTSYGLLKFMISFSIVSASIIFAITRLQTPRTHDKTGKVKWFDAKKGYGFITRDQGDDVFFHYRNIKGKKHLKVSDGQQVKFIVVQGDRGLQANEVHIL